MTLFMKIFAPLRASRAIHSVLFNRAVLSRTCFLAMAAVVLTVAVGCTENPSNETEGAGDTQADNQWSSHDFEFAVENLQRLESFSGDQMRQEMVDRFNQWAKSTKVPESWKLDPMVAELPKELAELAEVRSLDKMDFSKYDGYALQEAIWLRDLSNWARGDQVDAVSEAQHLFDWVVRNIQLEPDYDKTSDVIVQQPWETLLWGKGTAVDRAWIFILLLRQQDIDAVLLALPEEKDADKDKLDPWAVGVLVKDNLYLFDPKLGLPIPNAEGVKYQDNQLTIHPATLAEVVKDPTLLRKLDLPDAPYPVTPEQLSGVVALIEGSPAYLAGRFHLVESKLKGNRAVILSTFPSQLAERLQGVTSLSGSRLWRWPYEVLALRSHMTEKQLATLRKITEPFHVHQDVLWKGRVRYLKGQFMTEHGAMSYYMEARPSKRMFVMAKRRISEEPNPKVAETMRQTLTARRRGKIDATYWIGLVEVAEDRPQVAIEYFGSVALIPPWIQGARYNLGRVDENLGQPLEAAKIYRNAPESPATHGNLLRANWLDPPREKVELPEMEEGAKPTPKAEEKTEDSQEK